ncbi:MAG: hypothetical protein AAFV26_02960 [Pseudomonadota bacterium]
MHLFTEIDPAPRATPPVRLTERDAIDIWIARWLRIQRKHLIGRYGCDPRRLYEIWEGKAFPGSREKARAEFSEKHPGLLDRIDFGRHQVIPRAPKLPEQLPLFEE